MKFFEEIIFPPLVKAVVEKISPVEETCSFEFWTVSDEGNQKRLFVKCPVCFHTYHLLNTVDENLLRETLLDYEPFYYRRIIRECPEHAKHLEIENASKLL
jgi:hypothetical protein